MIDYPQDKISLYATKLVYFTNKYQSNEKAFAIKKSQFIKIKNIGLGIITKVLIQCVKI